MRLRYKFRYINKSFKLLNGILVPFQNFLLPMILSLVVLRLIGFIGLGQYLNNDTTIDIIYKIVLFCGIIYALLYCVMRKGVYLYNDHLVIARYTITLRNWRNRISIKYDDIDNVSVNYFKNIDFSRNYGALLVPCGDTCYNVVLTLKNGREYFFSIENQEEFCENLNYLIEQYTGIKMETAEDSTSDTGDNPPYSENS